MESLLREELPEIVSNGAFGKKSQIKNNEI